MTFSPEVVTLFLLDTLLFIFATMVVFLAYKLSLNFDHRSTSSRQYGMERTTYLASTIIQAIMLMKLISFPLMIYTLDNLSISLSGAMCAVGTLSGSTYGWSSLLIRSLSLYFYGLWLVLHYHDIKTINYKYSVPKYKLYILIYILLTVELLMHGLFWFDLDLNAVVSCCGTIFSEASSTVSGRLLIVPTAYILISFYLAYLVTLFTAAIKHKFLSTVANILFVLIAVWMIVSFLSPYVYQLPTHQCPFCLFQREYYYMGYLLYPLLLLGSFFGIAPWVLLVAFKLELDTLKISAWFNGAFVALSIAYPLVYFAINRVWL